MDYEYKDQPFSVEIAEALIPERRSHLQTTHIATLEKRVLDSHIERGGLATPEGECSREMVKKGLQNLSAAAKASQVSPNRWRYGQPDQWIFGTEKHWVYLYYFSADKSNAESKGQSVWECKIGSTKGVNDKGDIVYDAPEKRVKNQTRGCRVKPCIALLFKSDRHVTLENAIQNILTLHGKHLIHAQGTEWFRTSPSEVVKIVANIKFDLLDPIIDLSRVIDTIEGKAGDTCY